MALSTGTRLGPYEILAAVGAGGMGEVYRARDTRLHRDVAIKVLPASRTGSAQARERFQREARTVAGLQHPNICTVHDVGETDDGQAFLVMELLQGETLQQRIAREPIAAGPLIEMGVALADALDAAHAAGLVHRDIKPANVFLTARGPKLLDFGIAKVVEQSAATSDPTAAPTALTEPGGAVGTVGYMSPEQLRGEVLDARSDLFSLGLVLYEMATGRPPFSGGTSPVVAAAILERQAAPPSTLRPGLPIRLDDVVLKALEKDRTLRYQHAAEVRADLQRLKRDLETGSTARSVARGVATRRATRWWLAGAGVVVAAVALGLMRYRAADRPAPLTDRGTVVLADFANTTGDPVFDGTLRQGLSVQLQQSPFLTVASDDRVQRTLRLMRQPSGAPITPAVAREVCERTGGGAVLEGSIASLGSQYVIGLRATSCSSGDLIGEEQAEASRKEDVLRALSDAATAIRTRLGESLATIAEHNAGLQEATTPSLDAFKAYTTGLKVQFAEGYGAAVPHLKRAVEIDPGFAMAHAHLGLLYSIMGESTLGAASTAEAYRLRDRATDRERFFITATYHRQVTGNLPEAQRTFETWARTYPRDYVPPGLSSGFTYKGTGDYEKARAEATRAIALAPDLAPAHLNLAFSDLYLGRLDDVEQAVARALDLGIDGPDTRLLRYLIAFLKKDQAGMNRESARESSGPDNGDLMVHLEALAAARAGQLQRARPLSQGAADLARKAGQRERAAVFLAAAAVTESLFGQSPEAQRAARAALDLSTGRDALYAAAFALALTGDLARVQALTSELERRYPEDTSVQSAYLPTLRGLVALRQQRAADAIDRLEAARANELAVTGTHFVAFFGCLHSAFVRGQALAAAGRHADAAAEFRKLVDHRGLVLMDPSGALARLYLGRALARSGDAAGAKLAYQDLLTLWEAADPDLAVVQQARAEAKALP